MKDKFVLFVNYRFYGLINNPEESYSLTGKNDHRLIFPMSYEQISLSNFDKKSKRTLTRLNNGNILTEDCYQIKCKISSFPDENEDNLHFERDYLFDTGASNTTFCGIDNWDFIECRFISDENDQRIEELNSRIGYIMDRKFSSSSEEYFGKLIFLIRPLYIKIEDLEYIPLHSFTVPHVKKESFFSLKKAVPSQFSFLIGMDLIRNLATLSIPYDHPKLSLFHKRSDRLIMETLRLEKGFTVYDKYLEDTNLIQNSDPLIREMNNFGMMRNLSFRVLHEISHISERIPYEYLFTLKKDCQFLYVTEQEITNLQISNFLEQSEEFDGIIYKDDQYSRYVLFFKDDKKCLKKYKSTDKIASLKSSVCGFGTIMIETPEITFIENNYYFDKK